MVYWEIFKRRHGVPKLLGTVYAKRLQTATEEWIYGYAWINAITKIRLSYPGEYAQTNRSHCTALLLHTCTAQPTWLDVAHTIWHTEAYLALRTVLWQHSQKSALPLNYFLQLLSGMGFKLLSSTDWRCLILHIWLQLVHTMLDTRQRGYVWAPVTKLCWTLAFQDQKWTTQSYTGLSK